MYCGQITVPNRRNLAISNPKADLHNINSRTKFDESPLRQMNIRTCRGQITLLRNDEIFPSVIPNQVSTVSMHTPKFGENPLIFT